MDLSGTSISVSPAGHADLIPSLEALRALDRSIPGSLAKSVPGSLAVLPSALVLQTPLTSSDAASAEQSGSAFSLPCPLFHSQLRQTQNPLVISPAQDRPVVRIHLTLQCISLMRVFTTAVCT